MPGCESCNAPFTIFKRRRICADCRRYYCSKCLNVERVSTPLCERCAIFAKRPLLRTDLLNLKPKDLIFYLQSKHISTAGCVEKEELVGLVLAQIQQADEEASKRREQARSNSGARNNNNDPFDSLKQTCQNIFTNISDNLSDSFAAFEGKNNSRQNQAKASRDAQSSATTPTANGAATNITDQPRIRREIPTYTSSQNARMAAAQQQQQPQQSTNSVPRSNATSSESYSPVNSIVSPTETSSIAASQSNFNAQATSGAASPTQHAISVNESRNASCACDCIDDDDDDMLVLTSAVAGNSQPLSCVAEEESEMAGPSAAVTQTAKTALANLSVSQAPPTPRRICDADDSSQSSFEELGAIGGISDDTKSNTDTNSGESAEHWHLLKTQNQPKADALLKEAAEETANIQTCDQNIQVTLPNLNLTNTSLPTAPPREKKLYRRCSEGAQLNWPPQQANAAAGSTFYYAQEPTQASEQPSQTKCKRCGKNKSNIKYQVEKMRRHLESSQMSEADIKRELKEFLCYLESSTKSIDCSEADTVASQAESNHNTASSQAMTPVAGASNQPPWLDYDGIYVYGSSPSTYTDSKNDSRFISLDNFDTFEELEALSVKQLKEVLMLNRVDFKGCCEKQELLERVERLWKDLKQTPAVNKLPTDELCKICMDAPIECVILECGHMATCTGCGKVLSECPICRQYIVRVVRFFRA